jgi:hypothetical protein
MNRRFWAAAVVVVTLLSLACAKGGGGVSPGDPGVPTSHVILTVTVRDAKGSLITPAESPQWPNVVISVLGEDAHGEPPLNFPELLRKPMDENPWVRDISWPVGKVAKATAHVSTEVRAPVGTTIEVAWSHTDGRPGRAPGSHATDLNPGPGPRALDVVIDWIVSVEGPA